MSESTGAVRPSRREFVKMSAFGVAALLTGSSAQGAPAQPLSAGVTAVCRRLAPLGWRDLVLDVTGGQLDLLADNLEQELQKPLTKVDRTCPGFGDFAWHGTRAIEPGQPDQSLLYHALAAATVVATRDGQELRGFPTLAEIETVENFIYASRKATLADIKAQAGNGDLAVVVFAVHYRSTPMSAKGRHAQLCFARTGVAHLGTIEPLYDPKLRSFANVDAARPYDFRVTPRRFAAYLAKRVTGYDGKFAL